MKIGIYGGTFDPPHLAHMAAARAAMDQLELDRLLIIPDQEPPHKGLPADAASPQQRLEMADLMADGLGPKAEASDLELNREGKSYTADTLEQLHQSFPGDELWLLMGTDMFLTIENWYQPERIFQYAGVAAFSRNHEDTGEMFQEQSENLERRFHARTTIIDLPQVMELSSRDLRRMLAAEWNGGNVDPGQFLWTPVYGYILRQGLFGTQADMKQLSDKHLRAVSYSMVKAKRLPHIKGTEETAVALAKFWGEDPDQARRAAILHDCTKYWTLEEQLAACEKYNVYLDPMEREGVKFLHSKTGAALARHVFGEPEKVCDAIDCHTTGKPGMSTFDKILYLADYMEPSRDFEGVEELRRLVWTDLDRAMVLGLEMTMEELKEKGAIVHPNTLSTRDELRGRLS
ncbi:MAG: nicotinate (nicotinamide) nucleotide adenylyltransferase [Ruminiclostridium sp.]|nr:nicotinate (nicotinamide) nucleotide adenylyltransferase [Ruminiclostridium sp.]MCI9465838.1 nicotinate (nicotinamide) nucleotide adenylyltransferase [Ruminiclostridium sp.]